MWIVAIAWMYVTLMMALAEATSPQGTVLGAVFTFLLYGVGPLALVLYLMGAPARRKAILQAERAEREALAQQRQAEAESARLQLADLRYRNGVSSYLDLLDAQRSLFTAQQAVVQVRLAQLQNQVALYKALGGGAPEAAAGNPS